MNRRPRYPTKSREDAMKRIEVTAVTQQNRTEEHESAIPSVSTTLRMQRREQEAKERGEETAASRLSAQKIAEQNRGGAR